MVQPHNGTLLGNKTTDTLNDMDELNNRMLRERSQSRKGAYCMISYVISRKDKTMETESWSVVARIGVRELTANKHGGPLGLTLTSQTGLWWWLHKCMDLLKLIGTLRVDEFMICKLYPVYSCKIGKNLELTLWFGESLAKQRSLKPLKWVKILVDSHKQQEVRAQDQKG